MRNTANRKVVLASGKDAVSRYSPGTIFIIIGDLRGKLAESCYSGVLLVSRSEGHLDFPLYFMPLDDALKTLAAKDARNDDILSGERSWHLELTEQFPFYTVMREETACASLAKIYGPKESQSILMAANDKRTLDGLRKRPKWYKHDVHAYVHEYDFEASITKWTGYEDKSTSVRSASAANAEILEEELDVIPIGKAGAKKFEDWCYRVVRLLFKGRCDPIYLMPNGSAADRRDIVATNLGKSVFCERILRDYGARHVFFEVKNSFVVDVDAFRQVFAYTGDSYGSIAFLISRSMSEDLDKLDKWRFRNMHRKGVMVVQLSTTFLLSVLALVSEGRCTVDRQFALLLDKYLLQFINEPPPDWRADAQATRTGKP